MALAFDTSEERFVRSLLRVADPSSLAAVVLVGSVVRGHAMSASSDIDILTIGIDAPKPAPPRIQVLSVTEEAFRSRVGAGDDFTQWALRFGRPLAGRAYWARLRDELLPLAPWPGHERKRQQAAVRLVFAEKLAAMGDESAAAEELRFTLSHLARAVLLEKVVFPLSRGEIPQQLRLAGDHELADALEQVNGEHPVNDQALSAALRLARARLGLA